jgi:hypothetical protein
MLLTFLQDHFMLPIGDAEELVADPSSEIDQMVNDEAVPPSARDFVRKHYQGVANVLKFARQSVLAIGTNPFGFDFVQKIGDDRKIHTVDQGTVGLCSWKANVILRAFYHVLMYLGLVFLSLTGLGHLFTVVFGFTLGYLPSVFLIYVQFVASLWATHGVPFFTLRLSSLVFEIVTYCASFTSFGWIFYKVYKDVCSIAYTGKLFLAKQIWAFTRNRTVAHFKKNPLVAGSVVAACLFIMYRLTRRQIKLFQFSRQKGVNPMIPDLQKVTPESLEVLTGTATALLGLNNVSQASSFLSTVLFFQRLANYMKIPKRADGFVMIFALLSIFNQHLLSVPHSVVYRELAHVPNPRRRKQVGPNLGVAQPVPPQNPPGGNEPPDAGASSSSSESSSTTSTQTYHPIKANVSGIPDGQPRSGILARTAHFILGQAEPVDDSDSSDSEDNQLQNGAQVNQLHTAMLYKQYSALRERKNNSQTSFSFTPFEQQRLNFLSRQLYDLGVYTDENPQPTVYQEDIAKLRSKSP